MLSAAAQITTLYILSLKINVIIKLVVKGVKCTRISQVGLNVKLSNVYESKCLSWSICCKISQWLDFWFFYWQ